MIIYFEKIDSGPIANAAVNNFLFNTNSTKNQQLNQNQMSVLTDSTVISFNNSPPNGSATASNSNNTGINLLPEVVSQ